MLERHGWAGQYAMLLWTKEHSFLIRLLSIFSFSHRYYFFILIVLLFYYFYCYSYDVSNKLQFEAGGTRCALREVHPQQNGPVCAMCVCLLVLLPPWMSPRGCSTSGSFVRYLLTSSFKAKTTSLNEECVLAVHWRSGALFRSIHLDLNCTGG